ncbi:phytanoyl-CoA dioxygenase family protein [Actinomadura rugatobispora]|uniref:Phytanoyl-CoA dioxygenase family protein n=1 Tax=Actinomadura rugatobispora TaxID=1994 RepID=A0ABW1A6T0_9ACTN|nr:phytanoyl-CoA dioxygenase family protein [Actinomadura rugatobispora]
MTTPQTLDADAVSAALDADGFAVVPGVLDEAEVKAARERLWATVEESERRGVPTHVPGLDPNASNVRVFNLVDLDALFGRLLEHPVADAIAGRLLGEDYVVSNITANIARPGSGSMALHSDQALVHEGPWTQPWSLNVIWCLDDAYGDNGATLYVPGSHRYQTRDELPADLGDRLVPFEAAAGSTVVMEGRLWHTSGANITEDKDRPLVFAYYTRSFVRPQFNFTAALRPEVTEKLSKTMRYRLGLNRILNKPPEGVVMRRP